jgi:hypothetical protein
MVHLASIETKFLDTHRMGESGIELARDVEKLVLLSDKIVTRWATITGTPELLANAQSVMTTDEQIYAASLNTLLTQLKTDIDSLG